MKQPNKNFIFKEFQNRDLDLNTPLVQEIYANVFEAADILTRKKVIQMIDDLVDLHSIKLF